MAHRRSKPYKPPYPFVRNDGSEQADKLIAWWPGAPSGGGKLWNLSIVPFHGAFNNFASPFTRTSGWTSGVDGGQDAIAFDGTDDGITLTALQSSLIFYFGITKGYSVSFWMKPQTQSQSIGFLIGDRLGPDGSGWFSYFDDATSAIYHDYYGGPFGDGAKLHQRLSSSSSVPKNVWTHVVITRDSTNTMAGTKIYINGLNNAGTTTDVPPTPSVNPSYSGTQFGIGRNPQLNNNSYKGAMEDIRAYDDALTPAQIWRLYDGSTRWELRYQLGRVTHFGVPAPQDASASSAVTFTDVADSDGVFPRSASNTVTFSETSDSDGVFPRSASDTLTLTDLANVSSAKFADSIVTFVSSASCNIVADRDTSNTLVLTQVAVAQFFDIEYVTSTVTFAQALSYENTNRHISNSLTFVSSGSATNVYDRPVTDTLVFYTLAEVDHFTLASSTITFTQDTATELTTHAADTLVITQDATSAYTLHSDVATSTLDIVGDGVVIFAFRPRSVTDTLTFVSTVTATHVRSVSASNTFVITNQAFNSKVSITSNTLVFTDDATALNVHIRSATSTLVFTQTVLHPTTFLRSLTSPLVFANGYYKPNGSGGTIFIPAALPVKVTAYCTLQIPGLAITLPTPLLGDSEGSLGSVDLKRTMNGGTFTYVKRSASRELKYKFEISRQKAYEMRNFVQNALSTKVLLTNWKGELWYGNIMNNPFELTAESRAGPCGENYQIDLDFQGVRMN